MSRTIVLSSSAPARHADRPFADGGVPRLAEDGVAPVESPVHALQRELVRLDEPLDQADSAPGKAAGWIRVVLPVTVSIGLWIGIIRIIYALW